MASMVIKKAGAAGRKVGDIVSVPFLTAKAMFAAGEAEFLVGPKLTAAAPTEAEVAAEPPGESKPAAEANHGPAKGGRQFSQRHAAAAADAK